MEVVPHIPLKDEDAIGAVPAPGASNPGQDPIPGGNIPTEVPPMEPDELPDTGPSGPRTPYPVNDPGIVDPTGPGSAPDYLPGRPTSPMQL